MLAPEIPQTQASGASRHVVTDAVRQFILTHCLPGESPDLLQDDTPLVTSGVMDSYATMGLVSHLEQVFGIELSVYDTDADHFDRITDIVALVVRKQER